MGSLGRKALFFACMGGFLCFFFNPTRGFPLFGSVSLRFYHAHAHTHALGIIFVGQNLELSDQHLLTSSFLLERPASPEGSAFPGKPTSPEGTTSLEKPESPERSTLHGKLASSSLSQRASSSYAQIPRSSSYEQQKEAEIARLLNELQFCADSNEAKSLSKKIQRLWSQSGNKTIDLLMLWAERSIDDHAYSAALDYLDNVVALSPNYPEVWTRRAWVHIQLNNFKHALLDLKRALLLEPRNYIAYFQLGLVMEATERPHLAIKAYETALSYYPKMEEVQKRVGILLDEQYFRST
ncbi:tetratricopeptide repeat protein [Bartonella ancashensis]